MKLFVRTSIMYSLWKTCDITINPWRKDVVYGAYMQDNYIYVTLSSPNNWEGKMFFGKDRAKESLNLPVDYPRINQFLVCMKKKIIN